MKNKRTNNDQTNYFIYFDIFNRKKIYNQNNFTKIKEKIFKNLKFNNVINLVEKINPPKKRCYEISLFFMPLFI